MEGDIVFETPNVEGGDGNFSGNLIDAFVNINLSGEGSSWTGRSYQSYKYVDASNGTVAVVTSEIGENREYFGQVSGLVLSVAKGAKWETTGDSFANVLNMDSGNLKQPLILYFMPTILLLPEIPTLLISVTEPILTAL